MPDDNNWMRNYARYSAIAFQMIVILLGGIFLGKKLDEWLHMQHPVFLVIVTIISGFLGFYLVFRDLLKFK